MTGTNHPRSESRRQRDAAGRAGFTIIELLVVVSIIVVLAGMAMAQYRNSVTLASESVLRTDLFRMRDALDQYYADKQKNAPALDALVTEGYLRQLPKDPFTNSAETWQAIPAEADPGNPSADPGVVNVKSGSDRAALDGTRYADW
ncbi:MAG: prepilin-type N-terminal cleavage/methylation domain-containing protein [Acidobacteriota bacterium]